MQEYLYLLQHPDVILGGEDDSQHAEGGEGESGRCTVSAGHAPAPLAEPYKHLPGMGFSRTWMSGDAMRLRECLFASGHFRFPERLRGRVCCTLAMLTRRLALRMHAYVWHFDATSWKFLSLHWCCSERRSGTVVSAQVVGLPR